MLIAGSNNGDGYDYKPERRYFEVNVHGQFGGIVYYQEIQPLTFDCHAMYLPEIRGFSKEIGMAFWQYILTNTTVQCVTSFAARKFRHGQIYCAMIGLKRVGTIKKYFKGVDDVTFYSATREELIDFLNHGRAGVAGNMVIGSLADAANQRGDFAENAAINAGLNIATHGLINGVTRGVRGASNIISGNKTSAQRATTAATETSPFSGDTAAATNPAVHAAEARVAQGVPMTPATRNPEEVVRTVAAQKRPNLASSLDELDINPQAEVLESAERLNVDSLLPSHFSGNEQYKAVEQAIKSRAGSALQVQENEAIRQLAQGAGEIIDRVSGAKDALGMSDKFIDTVNGRMSALMKRSDQLYRNVEKAMPAGAKIDAPSTRSMLKQVAEDLGGMKNLDPIEKRVFRAVNPGKNGALTYANLNLGHRATRHR